MALATTKGGERSQMQKKKTAIITARMTPKDKAEIQRLAKRAGMTVTDYIVTCALNKEIVRIDGLDAVMTELKAQGKARFIGLSSHNTRTAMAAVKSSKIDVLMFPVNPIFNMLKLSQKL